MSTKTKHQRRTSALARVSKLAAQCSTYATARYLRNRGYTFEEAHQLLLGTSPEARQQAIRTSQAQQLTVDTVSMSTKQQPLVLE